MTKVCISSCVGALDWSTSPLGGLSRLLSLPRRVETSVCTHSCRLSSCLLWELGHWAERTSLCTAWGTCVGQSSPGPASPSPRHISQYCFAQTPQVWHFHWKQRPLGLNIQQTGLSLARSLQQMDESSPDQQHGHMRDHRITESQNGRGWKGPLWVI